MQNRLIIWAFISVWQLSLTGFAMEEEPNEEVYLVGMDEPMPADEDQPDFWLSQVKEWLIDAWEFLQETDEPDGPGDYNELDPQEVEATIFGLLLHLVH